MKKFIYLLCSVVFVTSALPLSAFAEQQGEAEADVQQEQIKADIEPISQEIEEGESEVTEETANYEEDDPTDKVINKIDIRDLTEEERQYVPEAYQDQDYIIEETPKPYLEEKQEAKAQSIYPDVNNYIRQKGWKTNQITYDYKSVFAKFQYRNFRPEGVVAHETANPNSTIQSEINYMLRNHRNAFVHAFVDHNNIIEIHPIGLGAWGAGPYANQRFIHVELVRVHSFDQFARSINNYADYIAYLLYQSGLPVTNAESSGKGTLWSHYAVTKHLGGTTHVDPHGYFAQYGYNWNQFVQLVSERHQRYVTGASNQHVSNPTVLYSEEKNTSRLAQIQNNQTTIYKNIGDEKTALKGQDYANEVFYVKKEVLHAGATYYLLSRSPSATKDVVGWAKASDLKSYTHKGKDKQKKKFFIKGNGQAFDKAWGGSKNQVYNLSDFRGEQFHVNLTETVGQNVWYRGMLKGKQVWIHSAYISKDQKTSMLGHIRNDQVRIYSTLNLNNSKSAKDYTHAVYYIKHQSMSIVDDEPYYLISREPSASKGVIGWVKGSDLSLHQHRGVDKKAKQFTVKGTGNAYTKAWGGSKDLVYNLANHRGQTFNVHLTEKVGNNVWYRGTLGGKTVWIHSSYVEASEERATSRLGHIRGGTRKIYKDYKNASTALNTTAAHTDKVYYIKQEATYNGEQFYKISTEPSASKGVVGWMKAADLSTHPHVGVDRKAKRFVIKGTGNAYTKAWGGSKDLVYNLANHRGQTFNVHLTEKVGNNIWYRGNLNGQTVWIHNSYVTE